MEYLMSDIPESNSRTAGRQFAKGNPGGPGRPRKVVKAAANALDERAAQAAPELFDLAFEQARGGSTAAVKMLLEHVWLVGRDRPLKIAVPEINGTRDLLPAGAALTNAVFAGEATAEQGSAAARVLKAHMQAIELVDIEQQLRKLEEAAEEKEKAGKRWGSK
jgi:hypothetical protein